MSDFWLIALFGVAFMGAAYLVFVRSVGDTTPPELPSDSRPHAPPQQVIQPTQPGRYAQAIVSLLVLAAFVWYFLLGGLEQQTAKSLSQLNDKVAADFSAQYDIARRSGSAADRCVAAGIAGASYLQAKNEAAYRRWKAVERADCAAAGVPQ